MTRTIAPAAVAHGRRAEERHEEIRPLRQAPGPERLAEILVAALDADHRREVEDPADAERGVEQHPAEVVAELVELALQQAVDRRDEVLDVVEDVRDARADELRHDVDVGLRHRLHDGRVDGVVNLVERPVHRLERVDARRRGRAAGKQRDGHGERRARQRCAAADQRSVTSRLPLAALSNRNWPISFSRTTADCVLASFPPSASIFVSPPASSPM